MSKGFGRRQTYESLTCRNPRTSRDSLWGFVLWWVRARGMRDVAREAEVADQADVPPDLLNCRVDLAEAVRHDGLHPGALLAWSRARSC